MFSVRVDIKFLTKIIATQNQAALIHHKVRGYIFWQCHGVVNKTSF